MCLGSYAAAHSCSEKSRWTLVIKPLYYLLQTGKVALPHRGGERPGGTMSAMTDDLVETMTPVGAEHAQLEDSRLTEAVRRATGAAPDSDVVVISSELETVAYDIGTVSTGA